MKLHPLVLAAILITPGLLTAEEQAPATEVAVQVAKVQRTSLKHRVTAYGSVQPAPASKDHPPAAVKLSPAVAGIVSEIRAVEGQPVNKGDVLFKLDGRAADAAVLKSQQAVEFATLNLERQRKLIAAEGTSAKQVMESEQALAAANAELAAAKVQQALLGGSSPISGTLVKFEARPGEAADSTTVLAEIVDLDRLVVSLQVPRAEAAALKSGQSASIASGDHRIESKVIYISPQVNAATDTATVRLEIPKGSGLLHGEFVKADVVIEQHDGVLAVPRDAVYTDYEGQSTLSVVEGDIAKKQIVKTGLRDGDLIEVEGAGIKEGTTVVTLGSYALPEETKVRILETETKEESK
jgi:RND family efflux transporter MFP subunit